MITVKQILIIQYSRAYKWRAVWLELANKIDNQRTANQQEYIEHRASLANERIAELMTMWDLHKPERI
jgi:hypothetical protein